MIPSHLNPLVLDPRSFPVVRPQITCIDDRVYFGSYPIAQVSPVESRFLEACSGDRSLADAAGAAGVDATCVARVASWLLWLGRKVGVKPQLSGRIDRLVLSSAHVGAWLGMGGRLMLEAPNRSTLVISCFGSLGETRFVDAFPTLAEVSMACRDEASFVARLAGVKQRVWDFPDEALRQTLRSQDREPDCTVGETLRAMVLNIIEQFQPSEIFAPAALGDSADGRLLFDTLLTLFADGSVPEELHLYEDEPVTAGYRQIDEFLSRFEGSYFVPREYYVNVTAAFPEKLSLTDAFRCTMNRRDAQGWSQSEERNAVLAGFSAARAERFWKLDVDSIE